MKCFFLGLAIFNVALLLINVAFTFMSIEKSGLQAQANVKAQPDAVVEATEVRLLDKKGNVRIRLATDADGNPAITMMKADNRQGVRLRVISDGPELELFGEGAESVWVHCRNSEQAIALSDKSGFIGANMWLEGGVPKIELGRGTSNAINDRSGLVQLSVAREGGFIKIAGNGRENTKLKVKSLFVAGCNEGGDATAAIFDQENKLLWQVP